MLTIDRPIIANVVAQHAEDAASLRQTRSVLVRAPHVKLLQLGRLDERIAAHLDGLQVAGEQGAALCKQALADPRAGSMFVTAVLAIHRGDVAGLAPMLAVAEAEPALCANGLASAFGWVSPSLLRGLTKDLLASGSPFHRSVGLAACEMHGVAADDAIVSALQDADASLRLRALRAVGRLGRTDMLSRCLDALEDDNEVCRLEAAGAALLLGERRRSIDELKQLSGPDRPHRAAASMWLLQVLEPRHARVLLKAFSGNAADARDLIRGIGIAGDPHFVNWLLTQMEEAAHARIAGEAFSLITGLDLAYLDLELRALPVSDAGPNDDPGDNAVAMDEDDSLPWPDVPKLRDWWQAHRQDFVADARCFMGKPLSAGHCVTVLRTGFQRQRILAARHLCLLRPGSPLFNCAAPTWRQQRLLSAMS